MAQQPPPVPDQRARGLPALAAGPVVRVHLGLPLAWWRQKLAEWQRALLRAALPTVLGQAGSHAEACGRGAFARVSRSVAGGLQPQHDLFDAERLLGAL